MAITDITQNLKTALEGLDSYSGTPTVELERLFNVINNRYPYIFLAGPYTDQETQSYNVTKTKIEYTIQYYIKYNDEDQTKDEITVATRNVAGDIVKKIMEDVNRGGFAILTKIKNYGNSFELVGDEVGFFIYVILEVYARFDATDIALVG